MSFVTYPILQLIGGEKQNQPKQLLSDVYSPESRDVYLKDEVLHTRGGLTKEISTLLSGVILHQFVYKRFDGSQWYIIFTDKDVYYYDTAVGDVRFITPQYNTGTVSVTNGSAVVTGSGTLFSSNVKAGDYFRIGALNDPNAKWYQIQSVDSDTQITLTTNYAETSQSGIAYAIRKVFTTKSTDTWRATQFTDDNLGDILVATNQGGSANNEKPIYWTGTGEIQEITGAYVCKDILSFKDRVILVHTYEGGSWQTQRYRWSNVADITTFDASDFQDLADTKGQLIGGELFENGNYLVLFKDDSKYLIRHIGGDYVFENELINQTGSKAIHSIRDIPSLGIFYFGSDLRFHIYTGANDIDISADIWNFINNIDPNNWGKIYAFYVSYERQIRVFIPYGDVSNNNFCLVYNSAITSQGREYWLWHIWEYKQSQSMRSIGEFWNISDYYVDEDPWKDRYVDEWDGYWDSRRYLSNAPIVIYGGDDGYLRRADTGLNDDGNTFTPYFISKRLDYGFPNQLKRLWRNVLWAYSEVGKSLNVYIRKGDNVNFELPKTVSIDDSTKEVVKKEVVHNELSDVFDVKIEGTPPWRLIGFISWFKLLRKILN